MIYLGENDLINLHIGSQEINRVLLGNKVIWENVKAIDLGTGTTFDLSSYPNYADLTEDNFFFTTASQGKITGYDASGLVYTNIGFDKTYDSSTGTLTMRTKVWSANTAYGSVHAYYVPNPSRLIYLGNGRYFNLSSYTGYQNFTEDNFLIKNAYGGSVGGIRDPLGWSCTVDIVKSYDQSNGSLRCVFFGEYLSSKSHSETWSHATSNNCDVYLIKRGV